MVQNSTDAFQQSGSLTVRARKGNPLRESPKLPQGFQRDSKRGPGTAIVIVRTRLRKLSAPARMAISGANDASDWGHANEKWT